MEAASMKAQRVERLRFRIFVEGEAEGWLAISALVVLALVALSVCLIRYHVGG
jgi:hypothetical protein